jgi:hypothetical protein
VPCLRQARESCESFRSAVETIDEEPSEDAAALTFYLQGIIQAESTCARESAPRASRIDQRRPRAGSAGVPYKTARRATAPVRGRYTRRLTILVEHFERPCRAQQLADTAYALCTRAQTGALTRAHTRAPARPEARAATAGLGCEREREAS